MVRSSANNPKYSLDGLSLNLLKLSEQTVARLQTLDIHTVDQLAYIGLLQPPSARIELTDLIQHELRAHLWLNKLRCYVENPEEDGITTRFIITSRFFHFIASMTSRANPHCTYQWSNARFVGTEPFQVPNMRNPSRRKKSCPVVSDLQQELPLFDLAYQDAQVDTESQDNSPSEPPDEAADAQPASQSFTIGETNEQSVEEPDSAMENVMKGNKHVEEYESLPGNAQMEGPLYPNTLNGTLCLYPDDAEEQRTQAIAQWDAYNHWNHTLIKFAVAGKRQGDPVFLSIDDDNITWLKGQPSAGDGSLLTDFYQAVHGRVVSGKNVNLSSIDEQNVFGEPEGTAFLVAMVIAASRMAAEEDTEQDQEVASNDYFRRLREVLGMQGQGRPRGMKSGAEEALWNEWSRWLKKQGFLPTARSSGDGPNKFISYPISQALLRGADKDRLRKLFAEKHWPEDWDAETLLIYVKREVPYLNRHLQELLTTHTERLQAVAEAIYDVYEDWDGSEYFGQKRSEQTTSRQVLAGLIRSENVLTGEVTYRIYPRISVRRQVDRLYVRDSTDLHTLLVERPGWYMPFHQLNEHELSQGIQFDVEQSPPLEKLILPSRSFWVLSPDPDDPNSGAYASWGHPSLGTPFIFLCRQDILSQIERLRDERLITWEGDPRDIFGTGDWQEIDQCQVISQAWSGVEVDKELHDMLRPRENLSISLSGGLRAPYTNGWMELYGPEITIFGFQSAVDITISRYDDDHSLWDQEQQMNQPFSFDWPGAGDYLVEARGGSDYTRRLVRIVSWDNIRRTPVPQMERVAINGWRICGALVEEQS